MGLMEARNRPPARRENPKNTPHHGGAVGVCDAFTLQVRPQKSTEAGAAPPSSVSRPSVPSAPKATIE